MNKKQSLFHIAKRDTLPWYKSFAIRGCAILLALVVCAVVTMLLTGENPVNIFATIFKGAFGSARKSWVTFQNLAVLLGISLAVTPAFKMRFWNIGAEGQVLIGCLATAACMICLADKLPNAVLILVSLAAALAAGALWGFLPAFFKAKWNTNETLFTLMMNYIATQLAAFFIIVWEVPKGAGKIGIINQGTEAGWLPVVGGQKYLLVILVVAVLTVFMYIYLNYSKHGYEIAVVGESQRTASYAGIKVERVIVRTMVLSGAVCGLMGLLLVDMVSHLCDGVSGEQTNAHIVQQDLAAAVLDLDHLGHAVHDAAGCVARGLLADHVHVHDDGVDLVVIAQAAQGGTLGSVHDAQRGKCRAGGNGGRHLHDGQVACKVCRSLGLIHDAAAADAHYDLAAGGQGLQGVLLGALVGVLIRVQGEFKLHTGILQALFCLAFGGCPGAGAGNDQGLFAQTCHLAAQQVQGACFLQVTASAELIGVIQFDIGQTSCFCHSFYTPYSM